LLQAIGSGDSYRRRRKNMKTRILRFSITTFLLLFIVGCASLGIDTKEKKFLVVQKEVNSALLTYNTQLKAQTPEVQQEWHTKYDQPIKAMSLALDAWQEVVMGITLDSGQLEEFMRLKNELIVLGWNFFAKEEK